ncbi:PH domain-containing protein [Candidatus Parcubacteria bacterium]|nr:PH domain-containing protein [Candidatus Parcubacteria bacterium]
MKQLHPRAIWLFFFQDITRLILISILFIFPITTICSIDTEKDFNPISNLINMINFYYWSMFLVFIILVLISYVCAQLSYRFYKYKLTDNEYMAEQGIIWKRYVSIPYSRIQNVDIHRGVIDRLLGLSDLQIHTAGYSSTSATQLGSEGQLPGISCEEAKILRDKLIHRVKQSKNQGL